ncbi:MAG: hypothetical protein BWX48_01755 [Verrucomicrobia bacterium ADurb.Bin006]|jgi:hypothetical protein|nr:MAG: hypothetical protein BWX48_01755 [Verrucomicrobia bacterium ADurb.Bin006]
MNSKSQTSRLDSHAGAVASRIPPPPTGPFSQNPRSVRRLKAGQSIQHQDTVRRSLSASPSAPDRLSTCQFTPLTRPGRWLEVLDEETLISKTEAPLARPIRSLQRLRLKLGTPVASARFAKGAVGNWEVSRHAATTQGPPAKEGGPRRDTKRWGWGTNRLDAYCSRLVGRNPAWRTAPVPAVDARHTKSKGDYENNPIHCAQSLRRFAPGLGCDLTRCRNPHRESDRDWQGSTGRGAFAARRGVATTARQKHPPEPHRSRTAPCSVAIPDSR